jgi:hypothetical protein
MLIWFRYRRRESNVELFPLSSVFNRSLFLVNLLALIPLVRLLFWSRPPLGFSGNRRRAERLARTNPVPGSSWNVSIAILR